MSSSVDEVRAAAAALARRMRDRGIDADIIANTLSEIDRQLKLHEQHTGEAGFDAPSWLNIVLSGTFYWLGRLQFQLRRWRVDEPRPPIDSGDWVLDVHIPAAGPLDPPAASASLQQATRFFDRHYPNEPVQVVVCESWLLDPFLAEHLAPTSNIVAFQRQFTPYGEPRHDELDAMYFTFGQRSLGNLDLLPRKTALQRLVLDRITAGGSWQVVRGYRLLNRRTASAR